MPNAMMMPVADQSPFQHPSNPSLRCQPHRTSTREKPRSPVGSKLNRGNKERLSASQSARGRGGGGGTWEQPMAHAAAGSDLKVASCPVGPCS
jgi:hypothetical protein